MALADVRIAHRGGRRRAVVRGGDWMPRSPAVVQRPGVAGIATDVTDMHQQRAELATYVQSLDTPDPRLLALLEPPKGKLSIDDESPAAMAMAEGEPTMLAG